MLWHENVLSYPPKLWSSSSLLISFFFSAMSQGYDKEAARKRRGEKRRLKRRSNAIKAANA